jgi:hypothetical protein
VKVLLGVTALLAAVTVHAGELDEDTICTSWARNATIGSEHAMMGHARRLVPLTLEHIQELIEHNKLFAIDGIPVFADDSETPESRAFLEDSVFYGFDYAKQLPQDLVAVSAQQMLAVFMSICRSGDRMVSR